MWSTAPSGGGIAVIAKGVLNISENVSIQNNQAVKYGGGIYSNGTVEINGTNVMISGNKAERGGGILGDGNSNTTITGNVTISNNTAEVMTDTTNIYGGGGCFHSGSTATLSGTGVVLEGNVAKAVTTALKPGNFAVGGGIYFGGNSLTLKDITIRGGLTDGSYNAERGGAIATSGSTVEMTGVTIDGNRALRQGGGIYLNNKSTTITDSTISNNFVDIITTDTETDGIYGSGGGIFTVSSATDCTIQNTKITNNTANALASWLGGGGIYTDGNTAMTLIGCTISGNQAANASGGGIQNRGTLTLQDTTVSNNTAKLSGGGIDHREKTVSVLGSVVISGNTVNGKADYDMSGVSFEDATYPYDGKEKTLEITGQLPEGVTVSYENNTLTNAGSVRAKAEFTVADTEHYNEIDEVLYADLTITKATPTITIKPDQATLTGSGTVTLTVEKPEDGKVTVACDKENVTVTENEDGTFTATLPNADETYTFTATVKYDETANYVNVDPVTCTVTVTYQSTSHGGGGSSRNNSYAVSTPKADNGSVTINNGSTAKKGDTVTITVKPDAGYEIDKVTVTDSKGNTITVTDKGDGKFSFVMPDSKVDVKATFVKTEPEQPSKTTFVDVPENSWYADAADFVAQRGLMSGVGENFFGGSQNTTRAMLMTILARMDGQDVTGGATWYEKAMNWAKQTGVSDGTMPEVNITREQLATMLYSYAKLKGMDPIPNGMALSKFSDADSISTWASEAVSWAAYSGIISGRSNGTVDPQAEATRAEMAVMLQQFVKLMEK